ncbi:unnamed protein product [Orchesella dallaii]|uniref:C3H1-type domain-containing protein n=1 Tax=Orchesella dallaii TaxID=48710 RepID=A0ABP1QRN4_9HEXA
MNEIGGMNGSSTSSNGGASSDSSLTSGSDAKLCRDFIRNVCNRGKNCKFIHPENIKIRTEPIFCHDFQQGRCRRSTCKFVHCSREVEEHFKKTGELPDDVYDGETGIGLGDSRTSRRSIDTSNISNGRSKSSRTNGNGMETSPETPICKDFLKGLCNRPHGSCKYRHVSSHNDFGRSRGGRNLNGNGTSGGIRRRGSDGFYDSGPETKKCRAGENPGYDFRGDEFNEDFYVGNNVNRGYAVLHPPNHNDSRSHSLQNATSVGHHHGPPASNADNHAFSQFHQTTATSTYGIAGTHRNGYNVAGTGDSSVAAYIHSQVSAETIKALEDENFMLKRRIEELKTSNEFLLSQNAQLRLNSSLSVSRTSVGVENVQVQPTVGVTSGVVQTMVSMAQPMLTPSLSVAATQPLSTISTLSTVSMPPVSISQALPVVSIAQHQPQPQPVYPMVTTQGVLPQPQNLT